MNERQQAREIANQWLDQRMNPLTQMVPGDPDCDACVLARQYMRALDKIAQLQELCGHLNDGSTVSEEVVRAAVKDGWPAAVQ